MTRTAVGAQDELSSLTSEYSAHNYHPLPVVVSHAAGCWVTGVDGRRYLDLLAGYSALQTSTAIGIGTKSFFSLACARHTVLSASPST